MAPAEALALVGLAHTRVVADIAPELEGVEEPLAAPLARPKVMYLLNLVYYHDVIAKYWRRGSSAFFLVSMRFYKA